MAHCNTASIILQCCVQIQELTYVVVEGNTLHDRLLNLCVMHMYLPCNHTTSSPPPPPPLPFPSSTST